MSRAPGVDCSDLQGSNTFPGELSLADSSAGENVCQPRGLQRLPRGSLGPKSLLNFFDQSLPKVSKKVKCDVQTTWKRSNHRITPSVSRKIESLLFDPADQQRKIRSYSKVARMLKLPFSTVRKQALIILRVLHRSNCKRGPKSKVTKDQLELVISHHLLQEWAGFSLQKRCVLLSQRFGITLSLSTLRRIYKANGISYRNAQIVSRRSLHNTNALISQRLQFAHLLANLIHLQGQDIIYVDESQFHSWLLPRKVWSRVDEPVLFAQNSTRHSCSVIGAISQSLKSGVYFHLVDRFNRQSFMQFITDLRKNLKNPYSTKKLFIVLDNHACHISSLRHVESSFKVLRMPPYSCQFNSIERLWSLSKRVFRLHQARLEIDQSKHDFLAAVRESLDSTENNIKAILKSNHTYIMRQLREKALKDEEALHPESLRR